MQKIYIRNNRSNAIVVSCILHCFLIMVINFCFSSKADRSPDLAKKVVADVVLLSTDSNQGDSSTLSSMVQSSLPSSGVSASAGIAAASINNSRGGNDGTEQKHPLQPNGIVTGAGGDGTAKGFAAAGSRSESTAGTGSGQVASQKTGGGSSAAFCRSSSKPAYPEAARANGVEGTVVVRMLIDEEGNVSETAVAESSGSADLDQAACRAVRKWEFSPATKDGAAVASYCRVRVNFSLDES